MARLRTANEIILNTLELLRTSQPNLDTKPGTVSRDLAIDGPSTQLSRLYDELRAVSSLQSLRLSIGSDLDKWAQNIGATRRKGSYSSGYALLCFDSLDSDFAINKGDLITAKNGATFTVVNSMTISVIKASSYKATASKYKSDLEFVGFTEQYAVEVLLQATATGSQGNISKYSLSNVSVSEITNITNTKPFGRGFNSEDDATFKNRILSIFSGANTGTELGYLGAARSGDYIIDAIIITPGNPLMTRDGTQVNEVNGELVIISEGSGGKVDVIIYGSLLQQATDGFIYRDLSNTGNAANSKNDFVLGQIPGDVGKTITRRRLENIKNKTLPNQPINNIASVSGSLSGANFIEKQVDNIGRITGNYELIKDTGEFAGSPWGFDRLRWIDNKITDFQEDKTKASLNSQDSLSFSDLLEVKRVLQNVVVSNENGKVNRANRSIIQLAHKPITNVVRVFNVTTGERYVVINQNPDGEGVVNNTGRIIISGKSLPAVSDTLQVDYTWVYTFDPYFDFDNRKTNNNPRSVRDSIDWGMSNSVRRERVSVSVSGDFLEANVTHPINTIVNVNTYTDYSGVITVSLDRYAVVVPVSINNVVSIVATRPSSTSEIEIWNTAKSNGSFSGSTIFLPTDAPITDADIDVLDPTTVVVTYNSTDIYNGDIQGNFSGSKISIPKSNDPTATAVEVTYIADITTLLSNVYLSTLPAKIKPNTNTFIIDETGSNIETGIQPFTNLYSGTPGELPNVIVRNFRQAPSNLGLNITGTISSGTFTITGTTVNAILDVTFACSNNGLKQELSYAIKKFLKLSSKDSIPSNISICRLESAENVVATSNFDVLSVNYVYDIKGYSLKNNDFVKLESEEDSSLSNIDIVLPSTLNNIANTPKIGDKIRVRFHIKTTGDWENVTFSKAGILYTDKKFAIVDSIAISSGFTSLSSGSAKLTVTNFNQPNTRGRYRAFYDYIAPKINERITVDYNFDQAIADTTLNIEQTRPINADVLVKSSKSILVDTTINIVVSEDFDNNTETVKQNVKDVVTATINSSGLGRILDSSDVGDSCYTIDGVDRVRVISFNKTGSAGSVLSIECRDNEWLQANNVTINIEKR